MAINVGRVGQVLSAGAVALSLIFVGTEIRQNTAAQRAQTRQALADGSREFTLAIATDPNLVRIYVGVFDPELATVAELTPADTVQAGMLMFANLRNLENVFLQSAEGVVDVSVLGSYGFTSPRYLTPAFARFWAGVRSRFDPRFVAAFEAADERD